MAILNTSIPAADARLVRTEGQPQDAGFKLFRGWPWLAGYTDTGTNSIRDILEGLTSTSYTNPQANGRVYTGKFVVSQNRGFDENEDGTQARDCKIVQELTKVKTVTNVASLGTPDKLRDRKTLNFLGFKEGEQFHIVHKYRNLDPADGATAMTLSPTESGYTIVFRDFVVERDKTGTLIVVFEDNDWLLGDDGGAVWGSDTDAATDTKGRVRVSYDNYDEDRNTSGHGYGENYQLTGLAKSNLDTNWVAAQKSDTKARVITNVRRAERANGEYVISQNQRIAFEGTRNADALYAKIRDARGTNPAGLSKIWFRRTDTARDALIALTGRARNADTYQGTTYYSQGVDVTDHGDGTYTVSQTLIGGDTAYGAVNTFFSDSYFVKKVVTRSRDDKKKRLFYWKFVAAKPTEASAVNFIESKQTIIKGSDHIVKKAPFYYVATCLTEIKNPARNTISDWSDT